MLHRGFDIWYTPLKGTFRKYPVLPANFIVAMHDTIAHKASDKATKHALHMTPEWRLSAASKYAQVDESVLQVSCSTLSESRE